jgi:hypothetical protein
MDKTEFLVICRILSDSLMPGARTSSHDTAPPDQNLEDDSTSFADFSNSADKTMSIYKWLKNLCRQYTSK